MNSTINDLINRRSVRAFSDEEIEDEVLNEILKAGTYAPNGRGLQSGKIVAIKNKELINEFSKFNSKYFPIDLPEDVDPLYGAKVLVIVLADKENPTYLYDGSAIITNLVNAAHALGVGSCWIFRAKEEFESEKGKEYLKEWGIPDNYEGIGHVVLGYPKGELPEASPRKEDFIHIIE